MDRDDRNARETQLREALNRAWNEYLRAGPEEKEAARARFQALLDEFTDLVRRLGDFGTGAGE